MTVDPADRDEYNFRTNGRQVCHWCYLRPQAYVWGPFGTRVCEHCQELAGQGQQEAIVEALAARMTVRDAWHGVNPEKFREHEHARVARWIAVRTTCEPID